MRDENFHFENDGEYFWNHIWQVKCEILLRRHVKCYPTDQLTLFYHVPVSGTNFFRGT